MTTLPSDSIPGRLHWLNAVLFASYLCVAIPLPALSVHVTTDLGADSMWAGLAVGLAFLSTVVSRGYAGNFSDRRGAKQAVMRGLFLYAAGAAVACLSAVLPWPSSARLAVLLGGRLVTGVGESLVGVGIIAWEVNVIGAARAGKALAMIGTAIYAALAAGGPLGLALRQHVGFAWTMASSGVLAILGVLAIAPMEGFVVVPNAAKRPSVFQVLRQVWRHGSIVGLQGIGFAAIGAFFVLYFLDRGWGNAGLGLSAFGAGFVLVRMVLGHLPDRLGGLRVASTFMAVEAVGQWMIWIAPAPAVAFAGAFLTGVGCSLIFPAMGREVVHLVQPHLRGAAMGGYALFQDLAYGLTGPVAGVLANRTGYRSVFLVGTLAAVAGLAMAVGLRRRSPLQA